jgi:hypothetical protein
MIHDEEEEFLHQIMQKHSMKTNMVFEFQPKHTCGEVGVDAGERYINS